MFFVLVNCMSLSEKKVIFTITTCMHLPGKIDQLMRCLQSLFEHETHWEDVYRYVLVNEYCPQACEREKVQRCMSEIEERYPFLEQIQKDELQRGQSASVNMIHLNFLLPFIVKNYPKMI